MDLTNINLHENKWQEIKLTKAIVDSYSLSSWAKDFSLMTAGYRDQLDPNDIANPEAAFNIVTLAILGEAKARVFKRKLLQRELAHVHIGGEVRPHTQDFICLLARIYSAHGMIVHLRKRTKTTPIWYSSFGIFYGEYQSGDNLTASHSPFFKGGWKPMDGHGKQLLAEEQEIISEVKKIVMNNETIKLAPWVGNENILNDFDIDKPYIEYQRTVIGNEGLSEIGQAIKSGFRCSISTVGGSMKATTECLFEQLGILSKENPFINYFLSEENSQYHNIGQFNGDNFGPDPGKWQVYKHIGAQEILLNNKADVVFIWDPDGDRFNIVTLAPASIANDAIKLGLEVEMFPDSDKCIVYFTPNQIFFMLTAYRINSLKSTGLINDYSWFITSSISTTRSISELAAAANIPVAHVRVGFKYMGTFAQWLEQRTNDHEPFITPTNEKVYLGKKPRAIIMCEESGGAIFGGTKFIMNKSGTYGLIALREKDGMQFALMTMSLAAFLYNSKQSFADYYCELIKQHKIKYKFFNRSDVRLYDESLTGTKLHEAKSVGIIKRDKTMKFFKDLSGQFMEVASLERIRDEINSRVSDKSFTFPTPKNICFVGDGTYLEFDNFWCLIRASGTDALLRYYIEGQNKEELDSFKKLLIDLHI